MFDALRTPKQPQDKRAGEPAGRGILVTAAAGRDRRDPAGRTRVVSRGLRSRLGVAFAAAGVSVLLAAAPAAAAVISTSYSGRTSDGGSWVADVPSPWNGTLLLFGHGFGPLQAVDVPSPLAKQPLLDLGYALAGSSYDPTGSQWALGSALRDQFQTLADVRRDLPSAPKRVVAYGISMGGLITALEDQHANGRVDGALTACGVVAGGIQLNNYQLDSEYTIRRLLAPKASLRLVRFASPAAGTSTGKKLDAAAQRAQNTANGRARLALAMAFLNAPTWAPGEPMPARKAYVTQEKEQYDFEFTGSTTTMDGLESSRASIEQAAGGNGSWTVGVNFTQLLARSPYGPEVRALYHQARLNINRDLATLTRGANIKADRKAVQWLQNTSVPTGHLQVPELDMHTIADQRAPVQQENYYAHVVKESGSSDRLRQAFVQRQVHCNFTLAELVAGLRGVQQRLTTGTWGSVAEPNQLQATANSLGAAFGGAAFIPYHPGQLSGDNGPFNPRLDSPGDL
jgi:hypothetical protein